MLISIPILCNEIIKSPSLSLFSLNLSPNWWWNSFSSSSSNTFFILLIGPFLNCWALRCLAKIDGISRIWTANSRLRRLESLASKCCPQSWSRPHSKHQLLLFYRSQFCFLIFRHSTLKLNLCNIISTFLRIKSDLVRLARATNLNRNLLTMLILLMLRLNIHRFTLEVKLIRNSLVSGSLMLSLLDVHGPRCILQCHQIGHSGLILVGVTSRRLWTFVDQWWKRWLLLLALLENLFDSSLRNACRHQALSSIVARRFQISTHRFQSWYILLFVSSPMTILQGFAAQKLRKFFKVELFVRISLIFVWHLLLLLMVNLCGSSLRKDGSSRFAPKSAIRYLSCVSGGQSCITSAQWIKSLLENTARIWQSVALGTSTHVQPRRNF